MIPPLRVRLRLNSTVILARNAGEASDRERS